MSFQDCIDRDVCKCGLLVCMIDCPHYTDNKEFEPEYVGLAELASKIDIQIEAYKKMKPSKERNNFRHHISNLIAICNRRGLQLNKVAPFKTMWW